MTGGWRRFPLVPAFETMLDVFTRFQSVNPASLVMTIYVINEEHFMTIEGYLIDQRYELKSATGGFDIGTISGSDSG